MNARTPIALALLLALAACSREAAPPAADAPADAPAPVAEAPAPAPPEAAPPAGQVPRAFLCRGNEPFWALDLAVDNALLKTPDGETVLAGELRATEGGAWTFRGAPEDSPGEAVGAVLSPAQCFDTMADGPAMPFSAAVNLPDGRTANGCCTAEYGIDLGAAPAFDAANKAEGDWSRLLPSLSAAVSRCAFDAGVATDVVTKAWPMNRGKATVRLRDSGLARFDCVVDLGSGEIESVQPVAEGEQAPGEGSPLWLPVRENPPVLHCGRVERVAGDDGATTGWLHYPEGC
jgi:uncharacterized membrane protein